MASSSSRRNQDQVKGTWTPEEDNQLRLMVQRFGPKNWAAIAEGVPGRTGKSCRLRWFNQLSPDINQGPFTADEDAILIAAHAQYGRKWSLIARKLPGRTDNSVKNRWNSTLRRRGFTVGAPSEYNAPQVGDTPVGHSASPASSNGSDPLEFQDAQGCQISESNQIQFLDQEPFAQFHEPENTFSLSQPNRLSGESSTHGVGSFHAFNGGLNVNLFQQDPPPPTHLRQSLPPPPQQPVASFLPNFSEKIGPDTLLAIGGVTGHSTSAPVPPQQTLPPQKFAPPAVAMLQGGGGLFNRLTTEEGARGLVISALTNKIKKRMDNQRMLIGGVRLMDYDENQIQDMANFIMNLAGIKGAYKQHSQDQG